MRRALISDIHGNLEALQAVMEHIEGQQVDEIYCLGDIIGYGPDPVRCLDVVMQKCAKTILGNHDYAALYEPEGFNPVATRAIYWTREQLEAEMRNNVDGERRWDFIGQLPERQDEGTFLFVHGSPRDPTNEYVFPQDIYEPGRIEKLLNKIEKYCFQGHTHIPGVFTESGDFLAPEDNDGVYQLNDQKVMVNVGSVGQPRDEDNRACYVILDYDEMRVEFQRVEYDYDATRKKIYQIDELDNMLGDRLATGR